MSGRQLIDEISADVAEALGEVIGEMPELDEGCEPSDVFEGLALRLILRLSTSVAILPLRTVAPIFQDEIDRSARRALDLFTEWLSRTESTITTGVEDGRFFVRINGVKFSGTSVQDAYAQAASALALEGDIRRN